MTVWFVALPALLVTCTGALLLLRGRGRSALGVLLGLDVVLLLVSLVVRRSAGRPGHRGGGRRAGEQLVVDLGGPPRRRDRSGRLVDRCRDRSRLHGRRRAGVAAHPTR